MGNSSCWDNSSFFCYDCQDIVHHVLYADVVMMSVCVSFVIEQDTTVFSLTLIISVARGQASFSRWKHVFVEMFVRWNVCDWRFTHLYVHTQIPSVTGLSWWWTKSFIRLHYAHAEPTETDKQKQLKTVFIRSISLVTFMHYCNIHVTV